MTDASVLVGKVVAAVEWIAPDGQPSTEEDGSYLRLRFTDGTILDIEGLGYDGLWDDVVIEIQASG
jgi:hypothetical protein